MDRLLSSSSSSLNTNLKPFTFLPLKPRFNSARFNFSPSNRSSFKWVASTSRNHENPSPFLSATPLFVKPNNSLSQATNSDNPIIESQPLDKINAGDAKKPKVCAFLFLIAKILSVAFDVFYIEFHCRFDSVLFYFKVDFVLLYERYLEEYNCAFLNYKNLILSLVLGNNLCSY